MHYRDKRTDFCLVQEALYYCCRKQKPGWVDVLHSLLKSTWHLLGFCILTLSSCERKWLQVCFVWKVSNQVSYVQKEDRKKTTPVRCSWFALSLWLALQSVLFTLDWSHLKSPQAFRSILEAELSKHPPKQTSVAVCGLHFQKARSGWPASISFPSEKC